MRRFFPRLKRLSDDRRGFVLVEFGFFVSILAVLMLAGFEIGRYVLLHQKLQRVATTVGDLTTREKQLNENDVADILIAVSHVMTPFELGADGVVIISSISQVTATQTRIDWQRKGGGTLIEPSLFGVEGGPANLPPGFTMEVGQSIVVAEVMNNYTPFFWEPLASTDPIYKYAIFRPRQGGLTSLTPAP